MNSIDKQIDPKSLKFRMISKLDFNEFKKAAVESVESNYEFLAYGQIFDQISLVDMMNEFTFMLRDQKMDHFGLFSDKKLLGHISYSQGSGPFGVELIGWVRNGWHSLGIGEIGLVQGTRIAFEHKNFNYAELHINEKNIPSRKIAEKVGYMPLYKDKSSDGPFAETYIHYVKVNPRVEQLARRYNRRSVDIMNCPAASFQVTNYLLKSDPLISFYEWPFPEYKEDCRPINSYALYEYLNRVNLDPEDLDYFLWDQKQDKGEAAEPVLSKQE
jgi:RimJ/RimL family protein N-acetyltransferase